MVDKLEHPARFDYAAMIESYGPNLDAVRIDRAFKPGETFEWEGYKLTVDWMPGQTEFALCLSGEIDGKRVAFTGDNIFGAPYDPDQTGHEAVVARNSAVLESGYIYGAEFLRRLKPDMLLGGHSWVMDKPAAFIERYRQWAYRFREALRTLSTDEDYRYWFDPYWVRAEPYRVRLTPARSETVQLHIRNDRGRAQKHHIEVHPPPGIEATPSVLEGELDAAGRATFAVRLTASDTVAPGVKIVALDITLDGHRYGEWFDFVVEAGSLE
jgi:glyoxylase-like metal-dependent hydrolase (beta-lactamase superfamily II)